MGLRSAATAPRGTLLPPQRACRERNGQLEIRKPAATA